MLGALFFTLWGTGSHADWLREWVATNIGSKFTLWAAYFAAAMVSAVWDLGVAMGRTLPATLYSLAFCETTAFLTAPALGP